MQPNAVRRATAARERLAKTETVFAGLDADLGALALEASEGKSGADKALAAHRSKIELAAQSVSELRRALALAERLDREADAAAAAAMREEQFVVFKRHSAARLAAAKTVLDAIAAAAPAFSKYAIETNKMMVALPTGTHVGVLAMGNNGWGGSWVGDLANLIAAEAFRVAVRDEAGRGARLPFSKAPEISHDNPAKIEPAFEVLKQAQDRALHEIELQMEKLNREQLAALEKAA